MHTTKDVERLREIAEQLAVTDDLAPLRDYCLDAGFEDVHVYSLRDAICVEFMDGEKLWARWYSKRKA